jgi:hypothetical protein
MPFRVAAIRQWLALYTLQATPNLLAQLQQQGIIPNAQPVTQPPPAALGSTGGHNAGTPQPPNLEHSQEIRSSSSSSHGVDSNVQGVFRASSRAVATTGIDPAALSPAGPAVSSDGGGELLGRKPAATTSATAAAHSGSGSGEMQGSQGVIQEEQQQQQPLMPLLQR